MSRISSAICYSSGIRAQESSAYIRIISPFNKLGVYLIDGLEEGLDNLELIREADVVIIQRFFPGSFQQLCALIDKCRCYNKKIIFDIDDLLFDLPDGHSDRLSFNFIEFLLPIYYTIQAADLVTVSTGYLKDQIIELNNNILVLPNYIDDEIWKFKPVEKSKNRELTIGYMGTKTHTRDLETIAPALLEILEQFSGKVLFKVYGFEPPETLRQHQFVLFENHFDINYIEFAKRFQSYDIDIGIAPLLHDLFNECKSNIKFLEYSISGIPGVYSNFGPYKDIVTEGSNGLLASEAQHWKCALKRLIEDEDLRFKLALQAQATVEESWTLSKNIYKWLSILENKYILKIDNTFLDSRNAYFIKSMSEQYLEFMYYLRKSILILEGQTRALEEQIRNLQNSFSWKMTQPLRILRRIIESSILHNRPF